jgi:hypothetical protein
MFHLLAQHLLILFLNIQDHDWSPKLKKLTIKTVDVLGNLKVNVYEHEHS